MEKQTVLEWLRMILIAFVIAMVINFFRVLIFQDGNFREAFLGTNNVNNEATNTNTVENTVTDTYQQTNANNPIIKDNYGQEIVDIPVEPLKEFSGLSKNEIFNLRKQAVNTSPIFSDMDYTPSNEVFGRIDDNLPWISAEAALKWNKRKEMDVTDGVSCHSAGILNPELLYYVSIADNTEDFYKDFYFLPYRVTYNPSTKTITAYIKNDTKPNVNYQRITLADSNAHDLGYKYAYMNEHINIGFWDEGNYKNNSLESGIKEVTGWYMHGSVCGVPGGCNNYAPYWQYYNQFYLKWLPATLNIKLWKNRPENTNKEADINFKMVFE